MFGFWVIFITILMVYWIIRQYCGNRRFKVDLFPETWNTYRIAVDTCDGQYIWIPLVFDEDDAFYIYRHLEEPPHIVYGNTYTIIKINGYHVLLFDSDVQTCSWSLWLYEVIEEIYRYCRKRCDCAYDIRGKRGVWIANTKVVEDKSLASFIDEFVSMHTYKEKDVTAALQKYNDAEAELSDLREAMKAYEKITTKSDECFATFKQLMNT